MGLAHLILDLDELRPKRRYADFDGFGPGSGGAQQQQGTEAWGGSEAGATGAQVNVPMVNGGAYDYGGTPGGAAAFNQQLGQANQAVQNQSAAQIQNANDARDQGNVQGTLGGLASFYQGQLNGTGPSLAAAQMRQATDQNIAAQEAAANSAHGSLAGTAAQMGAASTAANMEQNAANQSEQGRIQEEYNAANGLQGLGGLYEQEQGLNIGQAEQQAALQQQQQDLAARTGLGYAGLEGQTNAEQLGAQMNEQGQLSSNYLAASGMGMNQSQFNTTQGWNEAMGGVGAGLGLLAAFADADFEEPPMGLARTTLGPRGIAPARTKQTSYADGDMQPPAHLTMREERPVDSKPFLVLADQNNHTVGRVETKPLNARERARVEEPHGAGPLFADAGRMHTTMHDAGLSDPAIQQGLASLDWGASNDPSQGGTLLDQMRAQEAARVAAAAPAGGYTTSQQQFYPGARTPGAQPSEAAEFGPAATAPAPTAAGLAGAAVPTGGYGQGWDNVKRATPAATTKAADDKSRDRLMGLAAAMMQPHAAPVYVPPSYSDLDLDAQESHLAHLYADAKLGTGTRFAHLEHSLAARPGVHNPGALAAYIGRQKYGAHKMAKLSAHGRA